MFTRNFRRLYDPEATGGGAAPAAPSPSSPAGEPATAPTGPSAGSPGDTPYVRFQQQLAKVASDNPDPSQPGSDANKTTSATAGEEGDEGDEKTGESGTTAEGEETAPEGKGSDTKWSPDELKALKAHGLEDMPFHPSARKFMESNRELRSQFDRVSASNTNAITEAENIRQAAYAAANGDAEALQKALGVDLKLNNRGPDDILTEMSGYHGDQLSILQGAITEFEGRGQMEIAQALLDVGNKVLGMWNDKAKVVQDEKQWQEREKSWLQKAGKTQEPQDAYKALSAKAQQNLAALTTEDPEAAKYYKEIEDATKTGGPLRAIGIDLARAFGTNLPTAKHFIEIGKALHVLKNQPQILNEQRKKWESDYERKKQFGGTGGSSSGGSAGGKTSPDAAVQTLAAQMKSFMGR